MRRFKTAYTEIRVPRSTWDSLQLFSSQDASVSHVAKAVFAILALRVTPQGDARTES